MGWFDSYEKEYHGLLDHLTSDWQMRPRFAVAFLNAYRRKIGKSLRRGQAEASKLLNSGQSLSGLMALELSDLDYPLVATAYEGYLVDLRRGKHIRTDVELAIWAILSNRMDILKEVDKGFHDYLERSTEKKFPRLDQDVFTWGRRLNRERFA